MEYLDEYARWINEADPETVAELESIKDDDAEIKDRFYKTLEFGTAGLRGVLGAGINRMNEYVAVSYTHLDVYKRQGNSVFNISVVYVSIRFRSGFCVQSEAERQQKGREQNKRKF